MIQIQFLGTAKKTFSRENLFLHTDEITINELLFILDKKKPENTPNLDYNNILIAVNGVDSSALDGKNTILQDNDTVSIIPVIHGG